MQSDVIINELHIHTSNCHPSDCRALQAFLIFPFNRYDRYTETSPNSRAKIYSCWGRENTLHLIKFIPSNFFLRAWAKLLVRKQQRLACRAYVEFIHKSTLYHQILKKFSIKFPKFRHVLRFFTNLDEFPPAFTSTMATVSARSNEHIDANDNPF